jgi:hypothetical protein
MHFLSAIENSKIANVKTRRPCRPNCRGSPENGCPSISAKYHKATKADLKCDDLTLALSETLKAMKAEKGKHIIKREDKRCRDKEATCATFIELTK